MERIMTTFAMLKRTTAVAALAALPFAPAAALAESAQVTGTQPPAAAEQEKPAANGQAGVDAAETQAEPGQARTPSGETTEEAQEAQEAQPGQATGRPGQEEAGQTEAEATPTQGEAGTTGTQSGEAPQQGATGQQEPDPQARAGADEDMVVAKVGEREIRRSDVLTVIGMLPPQLQQQPPEMLIPIALDQLVMRELILQEAREAGLENDPAVTSLADDASERAREDAMAQVWLDKELGKSVTDEKVQQTYDTVKQQLGKDAPALDSVRPQIEQELRQQAFLDLSKDLQADADITLYGPDGQPMTR
jgi:hypothetical protein